MPSVAATAHKLTHSNERLRAEDVTVLLRAAVENTAAPEAVRKEARLALTDG
jgi:hypothetical protein